MDLRIEHRAKQAKRPAFSVFLLGSVALHALILAALPRVDDRVPVQAPPQPLEVVLVQPPIPVPAPPAPERVAPTRTPEPTPPRAKPAPKRHVKPTPATPPTVLALPEAEPEVRAPAPAPLNVPETVKAPTVTGALRGEQAAPATPSASTARPEPLTPPSFNAAYLRNPPPRYPLIARRNGEQGTVTLRVLVTREGLPGHVALEKTSGSAALDAAALATVKEWRFVPAQQNGQPVEASVLVPIVFRLQDAS